MNEDNRRIAKNTLMLYFRTFITVIVGIYTGRLMLEALGVDNYGIQNVVGGLVAMTGIITGTMTSASSRYITYSLGEGDLEKLKSVFVTSVNSLIILAFIVVTILEIGGLWWLNAEANIPEGRMFAANWDFQCSVLTLFVSLISVPYTSCIIAHEKMSIYAYTSIIDIVLRLLIVFAIINYGGDKLILLSTLTLLVSVFMTLFYVLYSRFSFQECRYKIVIEKNLLKEMTSYSGWTLFGNTSWILNNQGVDMLINVFFGVTFNAARGVANTINVSVQGFIKNFTTAFSPQLVKTYAAGELDKCYTLVNRASRFSWLLTLVFLVPICVEANGLLSLWLVDVPPLAPLFLQLAMFQTLSNEYSGTLLKLIHATGKIRKYSIISTSYALLCFPLTWLAYKLGAPVWACYPIFIFFHATLVIIRLYMVSKLTTFDYRTYLKSVMLPCTKIMIISFVPPVLITFIWQPSIFRFFVVCLISVLWTCFCCYSMGLEISERAVINSKIKETYLMIRGLFSKK